MTLHAEIMEQIIDRYGELLADTPKQNYDAVSAIFAGGIRMEIRFASSTEYSLGWSTESGEFRIDTAPLHEELATYPNHLHTPGGELRADPYTTPGAPPWDNIRAVLDAILPAGSLPE